MEVTLRDFAKRIAERRYLRYQGEREEKLPPVLEITEESDIRYLENNLIAGKEWVERLIDEELDALYKEEEEILKDIQEER